MRWERGESANNEYQVVGNKPRNFCVESRKFRGMHSPSGTGKLGKVGWDLNPKTEYVCTSKNEAVCLCVCGDESIHNTGLPPGLLQTCCNLQQIRECLTHRYDVPPRHSFFVVFGLWAEVDAVCVAPDGFTAAAERFISRPDIGGRGDVDEVGCRLKGKPRRRNRRGGGAMTEESTRGRDIEWEGRGMLPAEPRRKTGDPFVESDTRPRGIYHLSRATENKQQNVAL